MSNIVTQNTCFICLESDNNVIKVCNCRGTNNGAHPDCLMQWLEISNNNKCLVCLYEYEYEMIFKPSYNSFYMSFFSCKNIVIFENDYSMCSLILLFFFQTLFFLIYKIIFNDIRIDIFSYCFYFFELFFIVFLKLFYDKSINIIFLFKIFQFMTTIIILSFVLPDYIMYIEKCESSCLIKNNICNATCISYHKYDGIINKSSNELFTQLYLFLSILIIDILCKFKNGFYQRTVKRKTLNFNRNQIVPYNVLQSSI